MKDLTNNVRSRDALALVHLFAFEMHNLDGSYQETLYFTDSEIFVTADGREYTPLSVTFGSLSEDSSMATDSISINIDNINGALSAKALESEWRNNKCRIVRIVYSPVAEVVGADTYEFGLTDTGSEEYPNMNFDTDGIEFDAYILFEGVIDTFSATSQALAGKLTTQFTHWSKPYPPRTYNQNEFTTIIDAMVSLVYWGSSDPDE